MPAQHRYLTGLRQRHPALRECWLLPGGESGTWGLLIRTDRVGLRALRGDGDLPQKNLLVYVLEEQSGSVLRAWGRPGTLPFTSWDWEVQREGVAEFRCPVSGSVRVAESLWRA